MKPEYIAYAGKWPNQRVEAMTRSAVTLRFQSIATGALLVMPHPYRSNSNTADQAGCSRELTRQRRVGLFFVSLPSVTKQGLTFSGAEHGNCEQSLEATGRSAPGLPQERVVVRSPWLPVPQLAVRRFDAI